MGLEKFDSDEDPTFRNVSLAISSRWKFNPDQVAWQQISPFHLPIKVAFETNPLLV